MPYLGEHACRLADPSGFKTFRRVNEAEFEGNKPIDVIYGIKARKGNRGGKTTIQALRYDKDVWTEKDAREHCESREGEFHPSGKTTPTKPVKIAFMSRAGAKVRLPKSRITKPVKIAFLGRTPKRRSISNESPAKLTITHDLEHSSLEENLAARAYRQRAKEAKTDGDEKTAKLFEHIAKEEDVHEKEFKERSREI